MKGLLKVSLYAPFKGAPKIFLQGALKVAHKYEEKEMTL